MCQNKKELAWKINVEGTRNVAEACSEARAKMVYISTDYIFDGEGRLYTEADTPNPINHYGITKLEGENQVNFKGTRNISKTSQEIIYISTQTSLKWRKRTVQK